MVPIQMSAIPRSMRARSKALARRFRSLNIRAPQMNDTITELLRTSDTTDIIESGLQRGVICKVSRTDEYGYERDCPAPAEWSRLVSVRIP